MLTLLIDTHATEVTFALYKNEILMKKLINSEKIDHSSVCMPTLIKLLKCVNMDVHDLDDIVVVNGPGSFTGVRLGVTIAKTIAFTSNKPIRTMTSLEIYLDDTWPDTFIALEEKNGYYLGKWHLKEQKVDTYHYLTKREFIEFQTTNVVKLLKIVDFNHLIKRAHQKHPIQAHSVNPFYVKKIEVEK